MGELTVNTNTMAITAALAGGSLGGGVHYQQQLPSDGGSSSSGGGGGGRCGSSMISSHISSLMSDPCSIFSGLF